MGRSLSFARIKEKGREMASLCETIRAKKKKARGKREEGGLGRRWAPGRKARNRERGPV
jgi:hypothetical protein